MMPKIEQTITNYGYPDAGEFRARCKHLERQCSLGFPVNLLTGARVLLCDLCARRMLAYYYRKMLGIEGRPNVKKARYRTYPDKTCDNCYWQRRNGFQRLCIMLKDRPAHQESCVDCGDSIDASLFTCDYFTNEDTAYAAFEGTAE